MKISILTILEHLSGYVLRAYIQDGTAYIEGVRIYDNDEDETEYNYNSVYIGKTSDFWPFGFNQHSVVLSSGLDIVIIENMRYEEVVNRVIQVFEYYNDWEHRLREAQFTEDPFQSVLDVAHEVFNCPMLLGCKNLQIYAITQQYSDDQVYDGWDEVKKIKTMPLWLINKLYSLDIEDWVSDDIESAIIPPWPDMRIKYQLRTNCYLNGTLWGHLMIYPDNCKPYTIQLAKNVADVFNSLLNKRYKSTPEKYTTYQWLSDYLDGKDFGDDVFEILNWRNGWKNNEAMVAFVISPQSDKPDQNIYFWIYDNVKIQSPSSVIFTHKNSIVVIVKVIEGQERIVENNISAILSITEYQCGISYPFYDLKDLSTYYSQALIAITSAPESKRKKIYKFEDCPLSGIIREFTKIKNYEGWISPLFNILLENDRRQGTELYTTLIVYLENDLHSGNACKELYIHRNTMINRLAKITQLTGINFEDSNTVFYLKLCYLLIKRNDPENYKSENKLGRHPKNVENEENKNGFEWTPTMY